MSRSTSRIDHTVSSRRGLLRLALLGTAAAAAAGCTVSHSGTVTTATLDVGRVLQDGHAIVAALRGALAIPGVAALLGANLAVAEASLSAADLAIGEIAQLAGSGTVTVSIDTARVQSLALSLLADVQTVLALLQSGATATASISPKLATLIAAAATLVPLVQQAAGLAVAVPRSAPMSEADALRIAAGH